MHAGLVVTSMVFLIALLWAAYTAFAPARGAGSAAVGGRAV